MVAIDIPTVLADVPAKLLALLGREAPLAALLRHALLVAALHLFLATKLPQLLTLGPPRRVAPGRLGLRRQAGDRHKKSREESRQFHESPFSGSGASQRRH